MAKSGIAMILYTVRDAAEKDLPGTLRRVRECGFEYVQWSGMPSLTAQEIRDQIGAAGLKCMGAHCSVEPFEADFASEVAFWRTADVTDVAPGGMMGGCTDTLADWNAGIKRLDAVGAKLHKEGMRLSFHNHHFEFGAYPDDPRSRFDILMEGTGMDNLYAEIDVCWAQFGGMDPAALMRQYAGRCPLIHAKDMKAEKSPEGHPVFTPLGKGCLDWKAIYAAALDAKCEWLIYEQDTCEGDVFEAAATSCEFLKKLTA